MKKYFVLCAALLVAGNVCASNGKNLKVYKIATYDVARGLTHHYPLYVCMKSEIGKVAWMKVRGGTNVFIFKDRNSFCFRIAGNGELRPKFQDYEWIYKEALDKLEKSTDGFCLAENPEIPFSKGSICFPFLYGKPKTLEDKKKFLECIKEVERRMSDGIFTVNPNVKLTTAALKLMLKIYNARFGQNEENEKE